MKLMFLQVYRTIRVGDSLKVTTFLDHFLKFMKVSRFFEARLYPEETQAGSACC